MIKLSLKSPWKAIFFFPSEPPKGQRTFWGSCVLSAECSEVRIERSALHFRGHVRISSADMADFD